MYIPTPSRTPWVKLRRASASFIRLRGSSSICGWQDISLKLKLAYYEALTWLKTREQDTRNTHFSSFQSNSRKVVVACDRRCSNLTIQKIICSRILRMYRQACFESHHGIMLSTKGNVLRIQKENPFQEINNIISILPPDGVGKVKHNTRNI